MAGLTSDAMRRHFSAQAGSCRRLGSPFTALILEGIAGGIDPASPIGAHIDGWPGDPADDAVALRLAGGLHALVLTGRDDGLVAAYPPNQADDAPLIDACLAACINHADFLKAFMESPPQTNEVRRSAMLAPGFAEIAARTGLPLALLEMGASAGLNLHLDRYAIHLGERVIGDPGSAVVMRPDLEAPLPARLSDPRIIDRAGCDARPLHADDAEDRFRLTAYTWPDQPDRLQRLAAALEIAQASGLTVAAADAGDWIEGQLASSRHGVATTVYHSIFWQYLPEATRQRITKTIHQAAEKATDSAPLAWLAMEGAIGEPHAVLTLTLWPGGQLHRLAECDFHGRWLRWVGA